MITKAQLVAILFGLIVGAGVGYYFGHNQVLKETPNAPITSFEECAAAGYPIAESYPEQCYTPDGKSFVRVLPTIPEEPIGTPEEPSRPEPVACTADAKICPDGSGVGRTGPNCTFPPCPGE
ncbi:MAG: hypothetical protein KBD05_01055 [Candidatus Pacebacteria bacterium]|nr:hypothetical protein [Candidatus Paceibacterota bacterium]